jgi:type I restriction enzyme S subunit
METVIQKYPQYKDSGVDWMGQIPEHWGSIRLKNIIRAKISDGPHVTPLFIEEGIPFLSVDGIQNGELFFENCRLISLSDHIKYQKKCRIEKFDILMGKAASIGKIAQSKVNFEYSIWSPLALIKPNLNKVNATFLEYYLKSTFSQYQIEILCTSNTQKNISMDDIPKILATIPPLNEQTAIATFLDNKTALINQAIGIKQKQIELLKERRQILIHKAVTRGLNPNVKMKDSGVEWIGEIPETWKVVKLKYLSEFINDGTHGSYSRVEDGYRLLSVRNMVDDKFIFRDDDSRISEKHFKDISSKFQIRMGDINLAIVGATLGKVAIVDEHDELFVTQRSVCTIRVKLGLLLNSFLFYFIKSPSFQAYLWLNAGFSAQPGVYLGTIQSSVLSIPTIDEQRFIIDYLNETCLKYNTAISLKEQEIEKLKEYKATLINSAVTGKIKVN